MGKKGGSLKTKRAEVPAFWKISKKDKRFVARTKPGAHPKGYSYPLLTLMRDILSLTKNSRETQVVLNEGKVRVDHKVVKSPGYPVGMMDVIDIPSIQKSFRLIPDKGGLSAVPISGEEVDLKICLVKSKQTIHGSKIACGLHDGRTFYPEAEVDIRPGDSCILKLPGQEFQASFRLTKGGLALLIRGDRSGEIVSVEEIKEGTFSRGAISTVRFEDGKTSELPTEILMPVGKQVPSITISKIKSAAA